MALPHQKYETGEHLINSPDWDQDDSPWKAGIVDKRFRDQNMHPARIAVVGCGADGVLRDLERRTEGIQLKESDIAPGGTKFWGSYTSNRISFENGDFLALNQDRYYVVPLLDVIEHLPDPFDFLTRLRVHAQQFFFHIPLELSAASVLCGTLLLHMRDIVGHIHYFTKDLALSLLRECRYKISEWRYTRAYRDVPNRKLKTRLTELPRPLARLAGTDFAVQLLGGETLLVLATADDSK